jgi:DNA-binding transcriptional MerR regulator
MTTYRISEVAERTGFSPATIRYYEEIGVVRPASRNEADYRIYDERSLDRLAFVARTKQLGLSLEEVGDLTQLWDSDECGPVQKRMADFVTNKLSATRGRITELVTLADQLQGVASRLAEESPAGPCDDTCACNSEPDADISVRPGPKGLAADVAITCTLDAADLPGRISDWRSLMARATGREQIEGGVRIRFGPEAGLAATVADLAQAEQACCAHFDFAVGIGAEAVTLDVRAPFDVEVMVDGLFEMAIPREA